jgi:hypothetical protein
VFPVLEAAVCPKCSEERLLERVLGSLAAEPPPKNREHLDAVLLVEALERWDRHALHHHRQTTVRVDL